MIERRLKRHNEVFSRFFKIFRKESDCLKSVDGVLYLPEEISAIVVDAINLWEQLKERDPYFLTYSQKALLYPNKRFVFPNVIPNEADLYHREVTV